MGKGEALDCLCTATVTCSLVICKRFRSLESRRHFLVNLQIRLGKNAPDGALSVPVLLTKLREDFNQPAAWHRRGNAKHFLSVVPKAS